MSGHLQGATTDILNPISDTMKQLNHHLGAMLVFISKAMEGIYILLF